MPSRLAKASDASRLCGSLEVVIAQNTIVRVFLTLTRLEGTFRKKDVPLRPVLFPESEGLSSA